MNRLRVAAFIGGLCLAALPALAADLSTWNGGAAAFPSGEFDIHTLDASGRPIFIIDAEKRAIIVPDDVDVNATARLVIDAMGPYLRQVTGGAK